ncbi:MAG: 50S ribosomal protein L30 [Deltaproteobacteria bacterium]|jgi:large subunit ribosomal protein L30|nr:50S ribosomal protein L30 [Deltaproteobacteria bacterium]
MSGQIKVKQVKSGIGFPRKQRETLKGLGLKKMHQTRILEDTPAIRGMINKINHLVTFEEM